MNASNVYRQSGPVPHFTSKSSEILLEYHSMMWATYSETLLHLSGLSHILVARFVDDLRRVGDGDAGDLQDAAGREFHGDVAINVGS